MTSQYIPQAELTINLTNWCWENIPIDLFKLIFVYLIEISENETEQIMKLRRVCSGWRSHVGACVRQWDLDLGTDTQEPVITLRATCKVFPQLLSLHLTMSKQVDISALRNLRNTLECLSIMIPHHRADQLRYVGGVVSIRT